MAEKPKQQFGTRVPQAAPPSSPAKRSGHVALLVMGTIAVGSTAFALMPQDRCQQRTPGMETPSPAECQSRSSSSSSGGSGGSSRYYGSHSSSGTTDSSSVKRGGFGSSAHAFSSHFSFGS